MIWNSLVNDFLRIARTVAVVLGLLLLAAGCATGGRAPPASAAAEEVEARERAFAQTMARRDFAAFTSFLSDEAIFVSGDRALRGKERVGEAWHRFFESPTAPFSWEPDQVEALASGDLALSTGPVRDRGGKIIARFQSVWRREPPGVWRIVFDKGSDACNCAGAPTQ